MKKINKIIIGLVLLGGILILTCNIGTHTVKSFYPDIEDDPEDPGDSPGPGFGSKPPVAGNFVFTFWDEALPNYDICNRL